MYRGWTHDSAEVKVWAIHSVLTFHAEPTYTALTGSQDNQYHGRSSECAQLGSGCKLGQKQDFVGN